MNEVKACGTNYSNVTPALVKQVRNVISEADKHRYSVSAVYSAYNTALNKKDIPQSCSSCLRNRVRELRKWLDGYEAFLKKKAKKDDPTPETDKSKDEGTESREEPENGQNDDNNESSAKADPEPPVALLMSTPEGEQFNFIPSPENPKKGTVTHADGTAVKAGTYTTDEGVIAVQPGGKATIKEGGEVTNPDDELL
ncbi:hypothetical protein [Bacteroides sp. HPS0048]|uniref:hypothetical protein n=1 Tax=Bacteroides sp. HPS0048 TaxID=1078089 RepID=UPI00356156C2